MGKKNKPNKIKVVIDRPAMLEPGIYHTKIIATSFVNGLITMTIQVKQNAD